MPDATLQRSNDTEISHLASIRSDDTTVLNEIKEEELPKTKVDLDTSELDYVEPNYWVAVDSIRIQLLVTFGMFILGNIKAVYGFVFSGIIHFFLNDLGYMNNGLLIWVVLCITYYTLKCKFQVEKYPKHGYMVNFLLAGGINEKLVRYTGFVIDNLSNVVVDMCIMTLGIITANYGKELIKLVY